MSKSEENPLDALIDQALAEYMNRCDSGVFPDREAFLAQYPALREQLTGLLIAADWIEELAGPTLGNIAKVSSENANVDETLPHSPVWDASRSSENTALLGGVDDRDSQLAMSFDDSQHRGPGRGVSQPVLPCAFGDYVLERVLGRGGMGVVYYGRQVHLDRPVAVKMIRSGALASDEEVQRFYAEARSAAKLDHPNIVTVYQCGEIDGHHFFSMDYVHGTDLSRMIADGPLDCRKAARYVRDVARAIQFAHDHGILHRDLKPANVLVDGNDSVQITDFGLAKIVGAETGLTATGAALGTPSYMSPEQAAGKVSEQHHATDIYALGAVLFTVVTGQPPFKANSVVQTIMQVIHRPAPSARSLNPKVDSDVETIIDVCLQKLPSQRYATANRLADDLDRYLLGSPIHARPMPYLRRIWYWLLGVPIFGAILDNRVVEPTDAHRWVQRGLISVALLMVAAWFLLLIPTSMWYKNRMPRNVRVAAGVAGGAYDQLAKSICQALEQDATCDAVPVSTLGSSDNVRRLINGEVELAFLQADAMESSTLAVIAPLYYEAVHILVRNDSNIVNLKDLGQRSLVVGSAKTGSNGVARLLLQSAGLSFADVETRDSDWRQLKNTPDADAAIVVIKLGSTDVGELLCAEQYHLMALSEAWQFALDEPAFHPLLVTANHYPNCGLPETGIAAVATTAYLAAKREAPTVLVHAVLEKLFTPEMVAMTGIVSPERAAHWQGLAWHPAAREFFQRYRGSESEEVDN